MMKERPVIFTAENVKRILEGKKTTTRRPVKLPRWSTGLWADAEIDFGGYPVTICADTGCLAVIPCPYGAPGDWLYIRETIEIIDREWSLLGGWWTYKIKYLADGAESDYKWNISKNDYPVGKKITARFMPTWARRIVLTIDDVRAEMLHEISNLDLIEEGIDSDEPGQLWADGENMTIHAAFVRLWDSINAKRGYPFKSNPMVWVIDFTVLQKKSAA